MSTLAENLNCLYTDFKMLSEGIWVPDKASISDSISMLERITMQIKDEKLLPDDFELTDNREDDCHGN